MKVRRFAATYGYLMVGALVLVSPWPSRALAQDGHMHPPASQHQEQTPEQKRQAGALVRAVQRATERFQNVENAAPDYALIFGCVSGGDFGAMGMHFLNGSLLHDGEVNVDFPEILLYEPLPNGRLRLTGADYLVDVAEWNANPDHKGPPELMDSSSTCSTARTASDSTRSIRCMSGHGKTIPTARSRTGTPTSHVTHSTAERTERVRSGARRHDFAPDFRVPVFRGFNGSRFLVKEIVPMAKTSVNNGVNVDALLAAREALKAAPQAAKFACVHPAGKWRHGTHTNSKVQGFHGLGAEQKHKTEFSFETDHPEVFASEDLGATPVEYVLVGLASCLTAGVAAVAQNRGIQLRSVEAKIEGSMDIQGILGIDSDVRNGYDDIKVTFKHRRGCVPGRISRPSSRSRRSARRCTTSSPTRPISGLTSFSA